MNTVLRKILKFGLMKTGKMWKDESYLKAFFKLNGGQYSLNFSNPKTFNERLNWNKIYEQNPIYHKMVDKYEVKEFVRNIIGDNYIVPCYGVWNSPEEVTLENLPNQFVLKATYDSSGVFICRNKRQLRKNEIVKHFIKFGENHYEKTREFAYKGLKPRIIADEFLDDDSGRELTDYKFWCFNGVPKVMYITNKGKYVEENFYDMDFNPLEIDHGFPRTMPEYNRPSNFEEMKDLCTKLLCEIKPSFVRIDFFNVNGKVYFGEFTFYDWGGVVPFKDYKMDLELGKLF